MNHIVHLSQYYFHFSIRILWPLAWVSWSDEVPVTNTRWSLKLMFYLRMLSHGGQEKARQTQMWHLCVGCSLNHKTSSNRTTTTEMKNSIQKHMCSSYQKLPQSGIISCLCSQSVCWMLLAL